MIPKLTHKGLLPTGEHEASLQEVESSFGRSSKRRQALMSSLKLAVANFRYAGVSRIWINGSFVTNKCDPADIDGCWEYSPDIDEKKLDDVFLAQNRQAMKAKYGLDFFIANFIETGSGLPFPQFFQVSREGEKKGIILLNI